MSGVAEVSPKYLADVSMNSVPVGYKQTEVGVIPEDWDVLRVGEAFEICNNLRFPLSAKVREGMTGVYPYYGPTKIQGYINEYRVDGEYALIGEDGDHFLKFDHVDQTQYAAGKFNVNNHAHLLTGKVAEAKWFYFYFRNRDLSVYLTRQGAGRYKLNKAALENIPCPIPIEGERLAIANALSDVDALISELEKLIAKKQAIKTATMQQLLTGRTRLPPFAFKESALREDGTKKGTKPSELGEIPEDWEVVELGSVIERFVGGGTPSRSNGEYWGNEIPWVTVKDFATFNPYAAQESITKKGLISSASNLIPKGTLITSTRMALGKAVIYRVDVAINQDMKGLFCGQLLSTNFLYFWFEANANKIDELGSGSTVKGLALPDLRKVQLILPPKEEQTAIATILSDMDEELNALEQHLGKTRQIKQGMMQELLTGRTRLI